MTPTGRDALEQRVAALEREIGRLRAENDALGDRERALSAILSNAPAPVYLKDAEFRYLLVNPFYEALAHVSLGALRGKTDFDIFPAAVAELFRSQDEDVIRAGHPKEYEETIPLPDGEFTFITVKFPVWDAGGSLRGVGGFCTDITSRKRAEAERERLLLDLRGARDEVATLRGILPICSACKQVRDDKGYWSQIESYLRSRSSLEFTHSLCPACERKMFAGEAWFRDGKP